MVTFLLLNAIFWTGTLLIAAAIRPPGLDRVFAASILGFTIIVLSLILLSPFAALRLSSMVLLCLAVLLVGVALQYARGGIRDVRMALPFRFGKHHDVSVLVLAAITLWATLHYLLYGLIWPVQPISDAHYLPPAVRATLVEAAAVELVPTPFGEEAATYFPANGELWFTWLSVTSNGGPIIKVGQWPFLALGTFAFTLSAGKWAELAGAALSQRRAGVSPRCL